MTDVSNCCMNELSFVRLLRSLRGRRLKGKGKGVLGARETRGAREEGEREGNACQETIVFAIPPTNYVCKNNATVNDYLSNKSGRDALI